MYECVNVSAVVKDIFVKDTGLLCRWLDGFLLFNVSVKVKYICLITRLSPFHSFLYTASLSLFSQQCTVFFFGPGSAVCECVCVRAHVVGMWAVPKAVSLVPDFQTDSKEQS